MSKNRNQSHQNIDQVEVGSISRRLLGGEILLTIRGYSKTTRKGKGRGDMLGGAEPLTSRSVPKNESRKGQCKL